MTGRLCVLAIALCTLPRPISPQSFSSARSACTNAAIKIERTRVGASIATIGSIHHDQEQRMNPYERTPAAAAVCLALVVAAFWLFNANFEWPTSRLGRPSSVLEILVYDVLPIVVAGYVIGLGAIAIMRFFFPRSSIKVVLYVVGACAGLVAMPLLALSAAIGDTRIIRDLGTIAMLVAVPLAIATWAKREVR
jgi:hypothetical protein